jgi:hypothetical protein
LSSALYIVFEQKIPGLARHVDGKAVARASARLDSIAKEKGVRALTSFFSISPEALAEIAGDHGVSLKQPTREEWYLPDEGLKTVTVLIEEAEKRQLDTHIKSDLHDFRELLLAAKQNRIRWHLAVDY